MEKRPSWYWKTGPIIFPLHSHAETWWKFSSRRVILPARFFSRTTRADRRRCAILTATWSGNEVIMPGSLHVMKCSDRVAVLSSPGGVIFYTHPNWLICWGIWGERKRERGRTIRDFFRPHALLAWLFSSRFFSFSLNRCWCGKEGFSILCVWLWTRVAN